MGYQTERLGSNTQWSSRWRLHRRSRSFSCFHSGIALPRLFPTDFGAATKMEKEMFKSQSSLEVH